MIRIDPDQLATLLTCAVRYAMGRRSYVVSDVAGMLKAYAGAIPHQDVERIRGEIEIELGREEARGTWLGQRCDHETWRDVVRHLGGA